MPPTRAPPTFCLNIQHIHWVAENAALVQKYSKVWQQIETHNSPKSFISQNSHSNF